MKDEEVKEMKEKFILNKDHPRYSEMIRKWNKVCRDRALLAKRSGDIELAKYYWNLMILE